MTSHAVEMVAHYATLQHLANIDPDWDVRTQRANEITQQMLADMDAVGGVG